MPETIQPNVPEEEASEVSAKDWLKANDGEGRQKAGDEELGRITDEEIDDFNESIEALRGEDGEETEGSSRLIARAEATGRYKLNKKTGWLEWNKPEEQAPEEPKPARTAE